MMLEEWWQLVALYVGVGSLFGVVGLVVLLEIWPTAVRPLLYLNWLCSQRVARRLRDVRHFFFQHPVVNVSVVTGDGAVLGGWHILPAGRESRRCLSRGGRHGVDVGEARRSLAETGRVILFLHGVAGSRGGVGVAATSARVQLVRGLASHLAAHVVTFDYRGYGDSTGSPSEAGLVQDAWTWWVWLSERVAPGAAVYIYGQSLGTAVGIALAHRILQMPDKPDAPRLEGLILDSPFTSMREEVELHPLSRGLFTFLRWACPALRTRILARLPDRWASDELISQVSLPILVFHKVEDEIVPVQLGRRLFSLARAHPLSKFVEIDEPKVLKRHHVDASTCYCWIAEMHHFLDALDREKKTRRRAAPSPNN